MKRSVLSAAILAACAAGCARSATGAAEPEPASGGLHRLMSSTDIDGKHVGETSAEHAATVVVVFASWCGPCRHELALLSEIRERQPKVRIIGLNAYEDWGELSDEQRLRAFLGENAPWLQVVHADDTMLEAFGGVPKIPTLFVYDQQGRQVVAFRRNKRTPPTRDELESAISRAAQ